MNKCFKCGEDLTETIEGYDTIYKCTKCGEMNQVYNGS